MWVAGTDRRDGTLGLLLQAADGGGKFSPIQELRRNLSFKPSVSRKACIKFNQFRVVPTVDYLAGVGSGDLNPLGQQCYEFESTAGNMVVPGQLLVVALVGATTLMRAPLLSPQGPTALQTAFWDNELGKVQFLSTPRRMRQFQMDRWSTVCRMQWVLQFPTASQAWSSVYVHALGGMLDLALPKASATGIFRGVEVGERLMVTGIDLLTLTALEAPHPFASDSVQLGYCWSLLEEDAKVG
jgi:hypothetical protein